MLGRVPVTRPDISKSYSETSTRVPVCIAAGHVYQMDGFFASTGWGADDSTAAAAAGAAAPACEYGPEQKGVCVVCLFRTKMTTCCSDRV